MEGVAPSANRRGMGDWVIFLVTLLVVGLFFIGLFLGYGLAVLSGAPVTTTATHLTTLTMTATHSTTEIYSTMVPITRTYFTTSTETVTRTVIITLVTEVKPPVEETYSLKVLEVILDAVSEIEHNYYIFTLEATYTGRKSWLFNPFYLYLLSDKGYKYSSSLSSAERQLLSSGELEDGESIKGQISFKLPKDETPSKLIYDDEFTGVRLEIIDIPPPSRQVSWIFFAETSVQSEYSFIWALASVKTPGTTFYSGEEVEVELSIEYSRFIGNPAAITVRSITVDRFEILETDPKLPITVKDGEKVIVRLILRAPDEGYKGNLKITIYA